jgi:hypothetical protein
MPYKLRKAPKKELYWVVTTETGKKHSKDPIPLEKAKAQRRILESALGSKNKVSGGSINTLIDARGFVKPGRTWREIRERMDQIGYARALSHARILPPDAPGILTYEQAQAIRLTFNTIAQIELQHNLITPAEFLNFTGQVAAVAQQDIGPFAQQAVQGVQNQNPAPPPGAPQGGLPPGGPAPGPPGDDPANDPENQGGGYSKYSKASRRAIEHQVRSKIKLVGGGHYTNQLIATRDSLTAGRRLTQRQQAEIKNLFDRAKKRLVEIGGSNYDYIAQTDDFYNHYAPVRAEKQGVVDTFQRELTQYLNELPRNIPVGTENSMTLADVQTGDMMTDVNRRYYGRPQRIYGIEERQWLQGAPGRTISDTREVATNLQNYRAHVRGTPRPQATVDVSAPRTFLQRTYDAIFATPPVYTDETPEIWQEYNDGTHSWFSTVDANNQPYGETVWVIPDYAIERGDEIRRIGRR